MRTLLNRVRGILSRRPPLLGRRRPPVELQAGGAQRADRVRVEHLRLAFSRPSGRHCGQVMGRMTARFCPNELAVRFCSFLFVEAAMNRRRVLAALLVMPVLAGCAPTTAAPAPAATPPPARDDNRVQPEHGGGDGGGGSGM
jgi:hypothetical protein